VRLRRRDWSANCAGDESSESSPYTLICYYAPKRFARRSDACVASWFNKRCSAKQRPSASVSTGILADTEQE